MASLDISVSVDADRLIKIVAAFQLVIPVLEADIDSCSNCNYGAGPTGKDSTGDPCEACAEARVALTAVRGVLA